MLRIILLVTGFIVLILQHCAISFSYYWQETSFIAGIILLGIPHGAADMLVAEQNSGKSGMPFSRIYFLFAYLGRLVIFGLLLWLVPFAGVLFFIVFAAYHFGETDLHLFKTDRWQGKLLVISYGMVILNVVLFNNSPELQDLLLRSGIKGADAVIIWMARYRVAVLSFSMVFFFSSVFIYFLFMGDHPLVRDTFLLQFAVLVFILYNLSLVAAITFYFIAWHSVLSLRNIVNYLKRNGGYSYIAIAKQIILYSVLAIAGIAILGFTGRLLVNRQGVIMYVFAGLAVLTAPHMQVMHEMYSIIRMGKNNKAGDAVKDRQ